MTATIVERAISFSLDPANEAHEPPEAAGRRRDDVRLLVSAGEREPREARFGQLGELLAPGDVLVVNTSATIPAAFDATLVGHGAVVLHYSGTLPGGLVLVEVREPKGLSSVPLAVHEPLTLELPGGARARLLAPFGGSRRLWIAKLELAGEFLGYADLHGYPIRYRHASGPFPLSAYQTVFAREPGSAEMPSAARPFSHELVTAIVAAGVTVVPLLLHAGVSSLEGGEAPYPERYRVPPATASVLNGAHRRGARVVAVGTTVMRALATVSDEDGFVHAGEGFTEVVVTSANPVRSVNGLLTGWHEPESSHLLLLESVLGRPALLSAYGYANSAGYHWHEFGDSHLLLAEPGN